MKKITTFIKTILMIMAMLFAANSTKALVTMEHDGTTYLCDMNFEGNTIYIENCIGIIGDVDVFGESGGGGGGGDELGSWTPYPTGGGGGGGISTTGSDPSSGGGGGGISTTGSDPLPKPVIDDEICSKQFSSLGCIRAVERIYEINEVASFSWHTAIASFWVALNMEGVPGMEELTQGMNPNNYIFKVGVDYLKGSLFSWSGKCSYKCDHNKITKIENANNTFNRRGILGGEAGTFTLTRIDKDTGESIQLFEMIGLSVHSHKILFSEIERDGFPKIGEMLEKPFYTYNY